MTTRGAFWNAFDFLAQPTPSPLPPIIGSIGPERYLKWLVREQLFPRNGDDLRSFDGDAPPEWRDIADELATASLFGTGGQRVLITDADDFVSLQRTELENYVKQGVGHGVLALELTSLPANTNLRKSIDATGWIIDCRLPERTEGRVKEIDQPRLRSWLEQRARQLHGLTLPRQAMDQVVQLVGWEIGVLDQELAKLALFVQAGQPVSAELVQQVVGGWRTETAWGMVDAVAEGNAAAAIQQLDRLIQAGETGLGVLGSLAWSLRRLAAATRIYESQERAGQRPNFNRSLQEAGVRNWPRADELVRAERQLKQLGRQRATAIYHWLLDTDLALKGSHSTPSRARWALELLMLRLNRQSARSTSAR